MKIIDINNAIKLCHFTEGIYDDSIDATYIIHLLGNVTITKNKTNKRNLHFTK